MSEPVAGVIAAYDRFFTAFNSRDPAMWSDALNYPHVRVSPRRTPDVVPTFEAHASSPEIAALWGKTAATGWDHSVGAPPVVLHSSADKAHVLGGWTRYDQEGRSILVNSVAYVITQVGDHWGMQARFAIDAGSAGDSDEHYARAVGIVQEWLAACNARDWVRGTHAMNHPLLIVDPGVAQVCPDADASCATLALAPWTHLAVTTIQAVQGGPAAVNVAVELGDGVQHLQALVCVTARDGHWGIQAYSLTYVA